MTKATYVWRKGAIVVKESADAATIKPLAPGVVDAVWQAMRDREDAITYAILSLAPLQPPKPEIAFTSTPRADNWFKNLFLLNTRSSHADFRREYLQEWPVDDARPSERGPQEPIPRQRALVPWRRGSL